MSWETTSDVWAIGRGADGKGHPTTGRWRWSRWRYSTEQYCVSSKGTHLLRILPPRLTGSFARRVDQRVWDSFKSNNDLDDSIEVVIDARRLYETPTAWGGVGFRPLYDVRESAFVGAWLQCAAHIGSAYGRRMPHSIAGWTRGSAHGYSFHSDFHLALAALDGMLGVGNSGSGVLGYDVGDALRGEKVKAQKLLSRAVLAQRFTEWRDGLRVSSRARTVLAMASAEGRRSLASEWMLTAPYSARTTIHDQHYLTAIRKRLDVPVATRGDRCRVRRTVPSGERSWEAAGRVRGRECGASLMPHADHAQSCAVQARVRRHDAIADLCAAVYAGAGLRAHREIPVPEVKARHCWHEDGHCRLRDAEQVDAALTAEEVAVRKKYAPATVRPWVMTSLGRPGEAMCADLRRLARRRLGLPDVQRTVSPPSVLALLLQRWRAELSCTLVVGDASVYLDALQDGPQAVGSRALGRAEV
eukprot:gene24250-biopygen16405